MKLLAVVMVVALVGAGCAHAQKPERKVYVISEDASGVGSNDARGIGGSGVEAYCNELQKSCFRQCWKRKPVISSIPKHSGKHNEYCNELCLQEFMKCVEEQEELERQESRKELRFSDMEVALDWLRRHKSEVALGTVVVVAGVAFAIVIGASGALLLAPL